MHEPHSRQRTTHASGKHAEEGTRNNIQHGRLSVEPMHESPNVVANAANELSECNGSNDTPDSAAEQSSSWFHLLDCSTRRCRTAVRILAGGCAADNALRSC